METTRRNQRDRVMWSQLHWLILGQRGRESTGNEENQTSFRALAWHNAINTRGARAAFLHLGISLNEGERWCWGLIEKGSRPSLDREVVPAIFPVYCIDWALDTSAILCSRDDENTYTVLIWGTYWEWQQSVSKDTRKLSELSDDCSSGLKSSIRFINVLSDMTVYLWKREKKYSDLTFLYLSNDWFVDLLDLSFPRPCQSAMPINKSHCPHTPIAISPFFSSPISLANSHLWDSLKIVESNRAIHPLCLPSRPSFSLIVNSLARVWPSFLNLSIQHALSPVRAGRGSVSV